MNINLSKRKKMLFGKCTETWLMSDAATPGRSQRQRREMLQIEEV